MKCCFTAEFIYESHPFNSFDSLLRHVWARIIHVIWPCWFVGNQDKKPMILCARSTSRSRELSTKCRSRSENVWKVCLVYSQNNKIFLIIKHDRHIFWEIHEVRRGMWAFFSLLCFSDADWLCRRNPISWTKCHSTVSAQALSMWPAVINRYCSG